MKAKLIAATATAYNVVERIEEATSTTWQQLDRDATAEEDRRNRALEIRRLWGPKDAAETIIGAIAALQREASMRGPVVSAGEALARIADHFRAVWSHHIELSKASKGPRGRREVFRLCLKSRLQSAGCGCAWLRRASSTYRSVDTPSSAHLARLVLARPWCSRRLFKQSLSAPAASAPCPAARGRPSTSTTSSSARREGPTGARTRPASAAPTTCMGSTAAT